MTLEAEKFIGTRIKDEELFVAAAVSVAGTKKACIVEATGHINLDIA